MKNCFSLLFSFISFIFVSSQQIDSIYIKLETSDSLIIFNNTLPMIKVKDNDYSQKLLEYEKKMKEINKTSRIVTLEDGSEFELGTFEQLPVAPSKYYYFAIEEISPISFLNGESEKISYSSGNVLNNHICNKVIFFIKEFKNIQVYKYRTRCVEFSTVM